MPTTKLSDMEDTILAFHQVLSEQMLDEVKDKHLTATRQGPMLPQMAWTVGFYQAVRPLVLQRKGQDRQIATLAVVPAGLLSTGARAEPIVFAAISWRS